MKYAVILTGGKQHKVSEGDVLEVENLGIKKDQEVKFSEVLLVVSDSSFELGKPKVNSAQVVGKVLEEKKGKKIRVAKFKAKVRYRRAAGFRPLLTKIKIEKIESPKSDKDQTKKDEKKTSSKIKTVKTAK